MDFKPRCSGRIQIWPSFDNRIRIRSYFQIRTRPHFKNRIKCAVEYIIHKKVLFFFFLNHGFQRMCMNMVGDRNGFCYLSWNRPNLKTKTCQFQYQMENIKVLHINSEKINTKTSEDWTCFIIFHWNNAFSCWIWIKISLYNCQRKGQYSLIIIIINSALFIH